MLADALAGIIILCIGVTCIVSATSGARNALYLSQWKMKASNAATTKLEELMSKRVQELLDTGELLPGQSVSTTSDNIELQVESGWVDQALGLISIKITAHWQYGPGSGNVVYDTMLSRR